MKKKLVKKDTNNLKRTLFSYRCGCTCGCYSPGSGRPQEYDSGVYANGYASLYAPD